MSRSIRHLLGILLVATCVPHVLAQPLRLVAYFPEWGISHSPPAHVGTIPTETVDDLDVLIYAFAIPRPNASGQIVITLDDPVAAYQREYSAEESVDGKADDPLQPLRGHFHQLRKLRAEAPHLKILVALGGWTGSTYFSDLARTPESRSTFVTSCIQMFIDGDLPLVNGSGGPGAAAGIFDGFDIDWEYPITGGDAGVHHDQNDDVNLTLLLQEFRNQMPAGTLLTMATPGSDFRAQNFRITDDQRFVDWFNLMTYDYHGGWDNKTGHLTNLLTSPDDPSSDAFKLSVDNAVRLYRDDYRVALDKLVIGGTFYGRGWKNVSSTNDGLYQSGQVADGIYEPGNNYTRDLWPLLQTGYSLYWDDQSLASWLYSPTDGVFWTLDDHQSLALKHRYATAFGLGGAMIWEITGDDDGSLFQSLATGNPPGAVSTTPPGDTDGGVLITDPIDCGLSLEGFNTVLNADATALGTSVKQVEFFGNGVSLGVDTRAPFSWAWFNLPAGSHEITAVATDDDGTGHRSAPVRLTAFDLDSGVSLWATGVTYPAGSEVFYDGCLYESKRLHVGSRVRTPGSSSRYWSLVTCTECGSANAPPTVSWTAPPDGSSFVEETLITLEATASDPDGSVTSVDFFANGSLLGTTSVSPYRLEWPSPAPGMYELTARATDNEGGAATSTAVTITVTPQGGGGVCLAPAWSATVTYSRGDLVSHVGKDWRAKRTVTGVEPGTSPANWSNLGDCAMASLPLRTLTFDAYPNPFNPVTTLTFSLETPTPVRLEIFDALGRSVRVLLEGVVDAGRHTARFDGAELPGGVYLVRLLAGNRTFTQNVVLLK